MKIPAYLFLFFLLVSASCRQQDYPRLLAVADSLMDARPDSAWQLLRGISPEALPTEGERMRHRLLTVEAECRNGQIPANDSLLLPLIGYFQRGGETFWEARAEYNRGCILYNGLRQAGKALESYRRAEELAQAVHDKRLLAHIYNQISRIYYSQDYVSKNDSLYWITKRLAEESGDTVLWIETQQRLATLLMGQGKKNYPKAESLLLENYSLTQRLQFKELQKNAAMSLSMLYSYMRRGKQALFFAQKALFLQADTAALSVVHVLMGEAYYRMQEYDSASVWFNKVLGSKRSTSLSAAYMRLGNIAEKQGNMKKALEFEKKRNFYEEQFREQSQAVEIQLAEQKRIWQRQQQEDNASYVTLWTIGLSVSVFSLLAFTIIIYVYRLKRQKRGLQALPKSAEVHGPDGEEAGRDKESSLPIFEDSKLVFAAESEEANRQKQTFNFEILTQQFKQQEIYGKIQRILDYYHAHNDYEEHFQEEDKRVLVELVEHETGGFIDYLKARCATLKKAEVVFCVLSLIGLQVPEIAIILERDPSTMYKRQKLLIKEKLGVAQCDSLKNALKSL
ncbi:tetratricopeptide repeat protein [Mediterranea massiliensis]|uniref:tetratricopeptide repeat protein n=1 Tax=Mediterranea massiliensis TaxID=1841865 RepID=UPI0025A41DF3|nr:hypothetical protein [Mediterranea massiliensis]MDM8336907.1 hypothetical protein [Mediterranea massiliensis]